MSSPILNGNDFKNRPRRPTICPETCLVDPYYKPKHLRQKLTHLGSVEMDGQNEARLLVLYTGGTIGMKTNADGAYEPAPNFMIKKLRQLPMFHDTEYPLPILGTGGLGGTGGQGGPEPEDDDSVPLIMPLSKEGKRVIYQVCEYEPLLDSCNMTMTDWARLAFDIDKNYDKFDGFVILHGTDTMAYTAAALSFMLEDLGKPVVLTGSQIPIFETRSDGRDNFLGALIMAGHYNIPEVTIYFNNKLMRGNRTTKVDSGAFDAFNSPNLSPLAQLEIDIMVNWDAIFRPASLKKFSIHTNMNPHVGLLRMFPSITTATVKAFLQPPMKGVVVQTYGAGNGPDSRKDLMEVFEEASKRGVIIVNTTQCARGAVNAAYAAGKVLLDIGVIPGGDMTPEAALTKLSYVLGKPDWSTEQRRQMIQENIRGEKRQIASVRGTDETLLEYPLLNKLRETLRISSSEEVQVLKEAIYPSLLCAAGREGDIEKLEQLKKNGAQFNQTDYDGRSVLHVASSEGHLDCVKYLLENGSSVHARDRYGNSPLDDAVRFNHHDVIKLLVQTGAHINMPPYKLGTMLCNHLRERHHFPSMPDTSAHNGINGDKYYLSHIPEDGEDDISEMQSWYLAGADINQGDYDKRTALHVAVCHSNKPMVEYLMSIGARSDLRDSAGLTALDEATKRNLDEILEMLMNNQNN